MTSEWLSIAMESTISLPSHSRQRDPRLYAVNEAYGRRDLLAFPRRCDSDEWRVGHWQLEQDAVVLAVMARVDTKALFAFLESISRLSTSAR